MTGETPRPHGVACTCLQCRSEQPPGNPLDVLRFYAVTSVDGNPTRYDIALAQVEALAEAAQAVANSKGSFGHHVHNATACQELEAALVPFSPPPL